MSIREKTLVKVIGGGYKGCQGRVSSVYPDIGIAIVSIDEGVDMVKVNLSDLVEIRPQETETPKTEIPEGAKRITTEDYTKAVIKAVSSGGIANREKDFVFSAVENMGTMIVSKDVYKKIFNDQDSVVMTEEEFVDALWAACSPKSVRESVDNKLHSVGAITVSATAISSLYKVAAIIFRKGRK